MSMVTTASAMCMVAEPEDNAFVKNTQKTTNTTKAQGLKRMRAQDSIIRHADVHVPQLDEHEEEGGPPRRRPPTGRKESRCSRSRSK